MSWTIEIRGWRIAGGIHRHPPSRIARITYRNARRRNYSANSGNTHRTKHDGASPGAATCGTCNNGVDNDSHTRIGPQKGGLAESTMESEIGKSTQIKKVHNAYQGEHYIQDIPQERRRICRERDELNDPTHQTHHEHKNEERPKDRHAYTIPLSGRDGTRTRTHTDAGSNALP